MSRTVGAQLLQSWRVGGGHSCNAAAKLIGTDRETYIRWESGIGTPSLRFAATITEVTGISMESWLTPLTQTAPKRSRGRR